MFCFCNHIEEEVHLKDMDSILPSCHFYGNLLERQSHHHHRFTPLSFRSCNTTTTTTKQRNLSYLVAVRVTALNRLDQKWVIIIITTENYLNTFDTLVVESFHRIPRVICFLRRTRSITLPPTHHLLNGPSNIDCNRTLDASIHAKLILEVGKNPDKFKLALVLLDELAEKEDFNLSQQDCTAVMKVCIRLKKFEIVESLFNWFKAFGRHLSVVMYTTFIHSRYSEKNYRDALALVWEMEESNCLLDLPAYHVTIKLFLALNDLPRTIRYYSRLKEAGFTATFDIYRDMFNIYAGAGRLAKCKEVCNEIEKAGFTLDKQWSL